MPFAISFNNDGVFVDSTFQEGKETIAALNNEKMYKIHLRTFKKK